MFNLLVTYKTKDAEARQAFYDEVLAAGIPEATRSEEGNLRYDFFFSMERDNEILLVETWKDKESQALHYEQPHLKKLVEIKGKYVLETGFEEL